jgi:tetratricopeptide (TPR) repeat protein
MFFFKNVLISSCSPDFKMTKLLSGLVILLSIQSSNALAQTSEWKNWEVQADTLMNRQDYNGAVKLYSRVVKEAKLDSKENSRLLYKRSIGYYSLNDYESALKDILWFVQEFPENPRARILTALIYRQKGDMENQLVQLNKVIDLEGSNMDLLRWRGTLLMEKGEHLLAKKDLLRVTSSQDDPELETNLANAYYSLNNPDSALICINRSIELDATYEPAYLYAGSFCIELEYYVLAIKYLDIALLINPENASALFYKGVALIEMKQTESGCRQLSKAFKAGADDAAGYLKEHCYDVYK